MSRIGKLPIAIPSGVEVKVGADVVEVKGAKAALTTPVCDLLSYEVADGHITLTRKAETRESRAPARPAPAPSLPTASRA